MSDEQSMTHVVFMRRMPAAMVWGGLEKLMLQWFERIDFTRCRVTLVVSQGGAEIYRQHLLEKKIPVEVLEFPFQFADHFVGRFWETLILLRRLRPDKVVFSQGRFFCFDLAHVLAASLSARGDVYMHENLGVPVPSPKSSKKYFGFIPGAGLWWYAERYLTRWRAYFCKKVFVVSGEIRQMVIDLWKYPARKVEVLYHGVDIKKFFPSFEIKAAMRAKMNIPMDSVVIIMASRLSQEKCVDRAIDAFDQLADDHPRLMLLIAGTGPYEDRLKSYAQAKISKERIQFLGQVNNVHELYQMSDIYVLSSDNEGLSLAFLEAMASGLLCVTTRCTGTSEVIKDGVNGFLVEKSTRGVLDGLKKARRISQAESGAISQNAVSLVRGSFELHQNILIALKKLHIPYKE